MRSRSLHATLSAFAREAADCLAADRAEGAELPFDVVETGRPVRGGTALYCYRPMTGEFILARLDRLGALETYLPALRALAAIDGLGRYLRSLGRRGIPAERRSCAELALFAFLSEVFEDATDFEISTDRFERVYARLESAVYAEVSHTALVGVLRGVEMESSELLLGAGLALVGPESIDDGPPEELLYGAGEESTLLATLSVEAAPGDPGTVEEGRQALRGLVEALQLFGDACPTIDPLGWVRVDDGSWHAMVIGREAPTRGVLRISELAEDELRAFCSLVSRRAPRGGELAWALSRFRMGCERDSRWETLTDHLLALRALLEPEGAHTARLAGRLAALCALPEERPALTQRMADILALERTVMEGLEPRDPHAERLADEATRHLRALLRDVICGHLDPDLPALADGLIAQDALPEGIEADQGSDQLTLDESATGLEADSDEALLEEEFEEPASPDVEAGYEEPVLEADNDAVAVEEGYDDEAVFEEEPDFEEEPVSEEEPVFDEESGAVAVEEEDHEEAAIDAVAEDPPLDQDQTVDERSEDATVDDSPAPAEDAAEVKPKPGPARPVRKRARTRSTVTRSRSRS